MGAEGPSRGAAEYKRAAMLSAPPDAMWIVRGWRGIRTYLLHAAQAAERGDAAGKLAALKKSSELLAFLHRITPQGRNARLGSTIATVYERLHCLLALANANSDPAAFRDVSGALAELERVFLSAQAASRPG